MKIINEYKLYKMQELESSDEDTTNEEMPDFDMSDLDQEGDMGETPDFDMSDLDQEEFNDESLDGLPENEDEINPDSTELAQDEENPEAQDEFDNDFEEDGTDDEFQDDELEGEDSEFQGDIRNVPGACLIYKRVSEDSTYEELWIYNVGKDINSEIKIRRAILAGTDIKPQLGRSEDGEQTVKISSLGNVQYLNIFGLPN